MEFSRKLFLTSAWCLLLLSPRFAKAHPPKHRDYYELLEVHPSSDADAIKKSYRQLAKKHHPDHFQSLPKETQFIQQENFREINEAYEVLRDPQKRADYDRYMFRGKWPKKSRETKKRPPPPPFKPNARWDDFLGPHPSSIGNLKSMHPYFIKIYQMFYLQNPFLKRSEHMIQTLKRMRLEGAHPKDLLVVGTAILNLAAKDDADKFSDEIRELFETIAFRDSMLHQNLFMHVVFEAALKAGFASMYSIKDSHPEIYRDLYRDAVYALHDLNSNIRNDHTRAHHWAFIQSYVYQSSENAIRYGENIYHFNPQPTPSNKAAKKDSKPSKKRCSKLLMSISKKVA